MEKLKPIISEWFANLPNGYAVAPYTQDELNLLKIIITESDELGDTEKDTLKKHVDTINDDLSEDIDFDEYDKKMKDFDFSTLFDIPAMSPSEWKKEREEERRLAREEWYRTNKSFKVPGANTWEEAKEKLTKQYLDAKENEKRWASKTYKSAGKKSIFVGGELDGNNVSIDRINQKRQQNAIRNAILYQKEILDSLEEMGITQEELEEIESLTELNEISIGKEEPPSEKQDRFIAKSAPFMQSANAFIEYIKSEYTNPGIELLGLEQLFDAIIALDTDNFNSVVKLLAKHTNRQIEYGTFKMGQYELKLAELLHSNVKLDNASALNLLLAILFNGTVISTDGSELSKLCVSISGLKLIKCESQESFVAIQPFSPKFVEIYNTIQSLFSIMHDNESSEGMTMNDISTLLASLQDGSLDDDISNVIKQGASTKVPTIKVLAGKLEQMLQGKSPITIFETFKTLYNSEIVEFTNKYAKLFDVNRDKLVIESTSDIFKKVLLTNTLPATVQLSNSQIKIDARLLNLNSTEEKEK